MAGSRLQHLADQEAEKLALGIGADPDPYALERPLERANRMSRVFERQPSMYNVNAQGMPVAAIGQVDVTDPWGNPLMGMDSPYDASIAYAANPSKLASRQSFYFAPGSGGMGGSAPTTPGFGLNRGLVSPALSGISSISSSGNNAIWSEVSSSSSGQSSQWHTQSQKPLSSEQSQGAPYQQHPSHHANGQNKRRSVSFQGDLAALASGRRSPGATSMYERSSRNESGSGEPSSRMKARSSTHLPSLLGNGRRGSYAESRKSFVAQDLPPIPVDPKLLAKKEKRMSKAAGHASHGAKDRSDAMSVMSGVSGMSGDAAGGKASKRKSWFARSTSSDNVSLSSSTSRQHVPSQPSRPPPVPTLPPQHSGSSSLAPQHSGSSSSALSAGQPRSGPTTPLASPRLATPPAASIYGPPGSGNPSPAVSPLASPSGGGPGPALLRPGSSRQPSRAAMNMPSPVEEHPPSQLQIPATLQEASPTPTARSLSPVPSSAQLSLQPMPSDAAAFASSAPTTPTTSGLLAPAEIIKPSASSPDDLSAVAGGLPISSHTAIEAGRLPVRASSKSASPFGHGSSPSSLPPSLNLQQAQIPKTPSVQSISPDQIPLPDTPQYGGSITSSPVDSPVGTPVTSRPGTASGLRRLSPEQLAAKVLPIAPVAIEALNIPQGVHGRTLQPRASSPNLGRQNAEPVPELPSPISFDRSSPSLELPEPKSSRTNGKADQPAAKKSSKSPFGFFRRGRSKTLGESEAQQEQLSASTNGKKQPASTDSKSSGTPPVPTPQLSFSSSTTSTLTSSEAFYADFSPSARPSFSNSRSNSNSTAVTTKRDGGVSPAAHDTRKTGTFSSLFSSRKNRGAISTGPK